MRTHYFGHVLILCDTLGWHCCPICFSLASVTHTSFETAWPLRITWNWLDAPSQPHGVWRPRNLNSTEGSQGETWLTFFLIFLSQRVTEEIQDMTHLIIFECSYPFPHLVVPNEDHKAPRHLWVTNFTEATGNGKGGYSSAPEQMIYRVEYSTFCFCGVSWEILPTQILSFCPISCLSSLPFLLLPLTPRRFGSQGLALPARVAIGRVWLKRLACLRVFLSSEYLQSSLLQPFFALFMTSGRTLFICVYLLKEGNPMTNFHASSAINFFFEVQTSSQYLLEARDRQREE